MLDFDQQNIVKFFKASVQSHENREKYMNIFPISGFSLVEKINPDADILDVGCGKNLFKKYFKNLIGIDPIGTEADYSICLLDFKTDKKFDVVLCLGSIFGSLDDIRAQILHITTMLKPQGKIYWRTQPALAEVDQYPEFFYPWREETHIMLAKEFNFTLNEVTKEYYKHHRNKPDYRVYAEWTSNS